MNHIVSVNNVSKNYNLGQVVVPALRGVTLDVAEGEFLAIAGPSAVARPPLLNLIGCVDTPSAGTVTVDGKQTGLLSERNLTRLRLNTSASSSKVSIWSPCSASCRTWNCRCSCNGR